jgi:sec-independent protein translocase protein TatA
MAASPGILAFSSIGPMELLVIFLVILLLFGAKRIPEIARGLGKGIREFKSATKDIADEINAAGRDVSSASRIDAPRTPVTGTTPRASKPEPEPEKDEAKSRSED